MKHTDRSLPRPSLPHIIRALAVSSIQADAIATRLSSYSSNQLPPSIAGLQKDVDLLLKELAQSRGIIQLLQEEMPADAAYTDEQEQDFLNLLGHSLDQMSLSELSFGYTKSTLLPHAPNVRYLIALALLNSCTLRGFEPQPIWQEIVAKNGACNP